MTELEKCIKLAEAMGWRRSKWFFQDCYWTTDDDPILRLVNTGYFFDPFTNPTDDYKVLEWMRDNYETQEIEIAFEHQGFGHRWVYVYYPAAHAHSREQEKSSYSCCLG